MAVIHSLNLNEGGGIIPSTDISSPENEASVIIGIGGTGVETIKKLKRKIYTQLVPSNPGEAVPRYDMIKLLAIDTDDTSIDAQYSESDLDKSSEFVSLKTPQLAALLAPAAPAGRPALKTNPAYNNWMSIEQITPLLGVAGAGGIRQMGRFMLFQHVQEVYSKIQSSIFSAMAGMNAGGQVNIHIIAGISGGTGSGTFLDVCYLVRKVLEENGWIGKVFGYFYLPDVVISKPEVAGKISSVHLNRRNGYAAFRELDYLMNLEAEGDYFVQTYPGSIGSVKYNMPPVDLCHLVSATDAQGTIPANGFEYSTNVVTDYIMAYLAHVELNGAVAGNDGGLTMQGHLANIVAGVAQISRTSGANLNYTILGASNAEVPFSQIATYLAQGYYKKVESISGNVPGDPEVNKFATDVGLSYDRIYKDIIRSAPDGGSLAMQLKEVSPKDCKGIAITGATMHPRPILAPAERWYENVCGKVEANYKGLISELPDFSVPELGTNSSYIARIHYRLLTIAANADGAGGASFAAKILSRTGRDIVNVVEGLIAENMKRLDFENAQTQYEAALPKARDEFMRSNFLNESAKWSNYVNAMVVFHEHLTKIEIYEKIDSLLHILKGQLQKLYAEFYQKLDVVCGNLIETFNQNAAFLNNPESVRQTNAYTWRIIELDDVRYELDTIIKGIVPTTAAADLMGHMLKFENQKEWLSESDFRIGRLINSFMLEKFHDQLSKTVETYIRSKYPGMQDSMIIQKIESDILERADRNAEPMFWKAPAFQIDTASTFQSSTMTVPSTSTLITAAASHFKGTNPHSYAVRESGIGDRIFALRFYSGIPLYAYQGVDLMLKDYISDLNGGLAGLHLYEHNVALESKPVKTDEDSRKIRETAWGTYLPMPTPYSITHINGEPPEGKEAEDQAAFKDALDRGIIRQNASNAWCVYVNGTDLSDVLMPDDPFVCATGYDYDRANAYKANLEQLKDAWTSEKSCAEKTLLASTPYVDGYFDKILNDTFMHNPRLVTAVKDSLDGLRKLESEISRVAALESKAGKEGEMVQKFCDGLVTGILVQGIGKVTYTYEEYGQPIEVLLSSEPADLSPAFLLYKAFCGFKKLNDVQYNDVCERSTAKLGNLQPGDDAIAKKLIASLTNSLKIISTQVNSLAPERRTQIMKFYSEIRQLLEVFVSQFV